MIPAWLPWAIVATLVVLALLGTDSPYRTWTLAGAVLAAASWVTVDHVVVTDGELLEATSDAAATVDGTLGGVTQDRLRLEVEDRLGREVRIENGAAPDGGDNVAYAYQVRSGDDGPTVCVEVVELRVDPGSALGQASVTTDAGTCDDESE